jgi:hypothetical protein
MLETRAVVSAPDADCCRRPRNLKILIPTLYEVVRSRVGDSSPGNRRNLTRVVRPTRPIGIAAVLALSGH